MSRHVFVVCSGEHGEGHSPIAARSTYEAAKAVLLERMPGADIHVRTAGRAWMACAPNGVDEVWIHRLELPQRSKALCRKCGWEWTLRNDGTLANHRAGTGGRGAGRCEGSRTVPEVPAVGGEADAA